MSMVVANKEFSDARKSIKEKPLREKTVKKPKVVKAKGGKSVPVLDFNVVEAIKAIFKSNDESKKKVSAISRQFIIKALTAKVGIKDKDLTIKKPLVAKVRSALKKLLESKQIVRTKGVGIAGSFKLSKVGPVKETVRNVKKSAIAKKDSTKKVVKSKKVVGKKSKDSNKKTEAESTVKVVKKVAIKAVKTPKPKSVPKSKVTKSITSKSSSTIPKKVGKPLRKPKTLKSVGSDKKKSN